MNFKVVEVVSGPNDGTHRLINVDQITYILPCDKHGSKSTVHFSDGTTVNSIATVQKWCEILKSDEADK